MRLQISEGNQTRFVMNNINLFVVLVPKYPLVAYDLDAWRTIDGVPCVILHMVLNFYLLLIFTVPRRLTAAPLVNSSVHQ